MGSDTGQNEKWQLSMLAGLSAVYFLLRKNKGTLRKRSSRDVAGPLSLHC